jgi:hypothetical protein
MLLAQTTGLFFHNDALAEDGYVFFSPMGTEQSYLMDKDANIINTWDFSDTPGLLGYFQPDGGVIRASGGQGGNGAIVAAGSGGLIEKVDWDGNPVWSFTYNQTAAPAHLQHHDIEVLPNGNILLMAWEEKTKAQATAAGRNPASPEAELYPDTLVEIEPTTGTVVWEWKVWDHLVQDFDNTKPNYLGPTGVFDHPELIDLNYRSTGTGAGAADDWTHGNGLDYNAELDQILFSVREFSEFWIIDHSTTTAEAAGHTGGNSGKGGDLLYRWGNPQTYDRGAPANRQLYYQHDAQWIENGNITVFNNGYGAPANPDVSSVVEITPPLLPDGSYTLNAGQAYGPTTPAWTYTGAVNDFAAIISGAQRLPNGNTLICYGVDGTFSEVTPAGVEVWRYVSPYIDGGVLGPEDPIPNQGIPIPGLDALHENYTFQALHYPLDFAPQLSSTVTGRRIFYNNSIWDNSTFGFNNASAIAPDKSAYIPSGFPTGTVTVGVQNVTNYSRGINGIMVELTGPERTLTPADFTVRMSGQDLAANNTPSTWAAAPAFTVTKVTDTPSPGTDRYELVWPDGSIVNRYVQVIVEGNDAAGGFNTNTGLATSDTFYFGNRIADAFTNYPGFFTTDATDALEARFNQNPFVGITNPYDFDRDAVVNATDELIARFNQNFMAALVLSSPPAAPEGAGDDGSGSAVASALAAPAGTPDVQQSAALWLGAPANYHGTDLSRTALSVEPSEGVKVDALATVAGADSLGDDLAIDDELLEALLE